MHPFISIVTATYNAAEPVSRLLDSLAKQTYKNFEWILQDGASTDSTISIVNSFEGKLPSMSVGSEKDSGIYNAWNNALPRVRGKWILFLGADDALAADDVLERTAQELEKLPESIQYFSCPLSLVDKTGKEVKVLTPHEDPFSVMPERMPFPHCSLFHSASLFQERVFTEQFRITGDYDLLCSTVRPDNFALGDILVTKMENGGISATRNWRDLLFKEKYLVRQRYFPVKELGYHLHSLRRYLWLWGKCSVRRKLAAMRS